MASVNKVILIGKLGRDPEMRHTPNGSAVATLNIATTETWNDNGNRQERTEWHRVIVWGKQAENCSKYLSKGREAYIEGRLQTRSWDDTKTGEKRYATEIVATTVQFLGGHGPEKSNDPSSLNEIPQNEYEETKSAFDPVPV